MPTLIERIEQQVPQQYSAFEAIDKLTKQFGQQVADRLKYQKQLSKKEITELMDSGLDQFRNQIKQNPEMIDQLLMQVENMLAAHHTPRVNPVQDKKAKAEVGNKAQATANYADVPWLRNLDSSDAPNIRRNAIDRLSENKDQRPGEFIEQFKNVLRADAENRLRKKLKLQMPAPAPRPSKSNRPTPYSGG